MSKAQTEKTTWIFIFQKYGKYFEAFPLKLFINFIFSEYLK